MKRVLLRLFSLRPDQQDSDAIDAAMRSGAQFGGTNLWVLFFAILIASVGLNVNSTAAIIGAMLISPLMGPIVGIGYGAAVLDHGLIRTAFKNLALFVALSLVTSVLYFAASPLDEPGSELLARTSPTLWDVLIAAFGGAAGMVAVTRKSFSNIVPGVAIATALMPPLCTVGFGIAHQRWDMVGGAFYLFLINGVFIAAATLLVARLLRLPTRGAIDDEQRNLHRGLILAGLTVVLVPSVWLGWRFVQQVVFDSAAQRVARELEREASLAVLGHEIDRERRVLQLTTVGRHHAEEVGARAQALLAARGLQDFSVVLRNAGDATLEVQSLRRQLQDDVNRALAQQVLANEQRLARLESTVAQLQPSAALPALDAPQIAREVRAQLPEASDVTVVPFRAAAEPGGAETVLVVVVLPRPLSATERARMQRWLEARLAPSAIQLVDRLVEAKTVAKKP